MDPSAELLLLTIAMLTVYVLGVGGTTAGAIRIRERWRQRTIDPASLEPRPGHEVVLSAPSLSPCVAFQPSLGSRRRSRRIVVIR